MDITYLGAGCVRISGKNLNIICNPFDESRGLGKPTAKADVVTMSGEEGLAATPGAMVIDSPGEFEIKGATITGVPARLHTDESGERATVYSILVDGVNIVVTGNIAGKLDEQQIENLGQVDVLVVPVGGYGLTLDAEGAAEVVAQLEPAFVVPVHYADERTKYPVAQDGVDMFLKEMGASPEPESKLRVNQKDIPTETQVVLLTRAGS